MSIFERALHIPAEPGLAEPRRTSHERVLLPLVARPAPRFYGAIVLAAFAAAACLLMGIEAIRAGNSLIFAAAFLAAAIPPAAVAVTGVLDAPRGPLTIDAEGVCDPRLRLGPIRWTEVERVELVAAANGIAAVRLTMCHDGPPRGNPFRIGGSSLDWARRRRTRLVPLMLLDVRAHTLAHAILVLAARHGAVVPPRRE